MSTICIQCALRAFVQDEPLPDMAFNESLSEHMRQYHPDRDQREQERERLERLAREKVARTIRQEVVKR